MKKLIVCVCVCVMLSMSAFAADKTLHLVATIYNKNGEPVKEAPVEFIYYDDTSRLEIGWLTDSKGRVDIPVRVSREKGLLYAWSPDCYPVSVNEEKYPRRVKASANYAYVALIKGDPAPVPKPSPYVPKPPKPYRNER